MFLLLFLFQGAALQLSRVADSLQKVRIYGMTFQWREEKKHLHVEQMSNSFAQWSPKLRLYMNQHLCKLLFRRSFASPITTARWFHLFFSLMMAKAPVLPILDVLCIQWEEMFCFCSKPDLSLSQLPSFDECVKCPLRAYHSSFYTTVCRKVIPGKVPGIWHTLFSVFNETAFSSSPKPTVSKREPDLTTVRLWLSCLSDKLTKKEALRMSLDD